MKIIKQKNYFHVFLEGEKFDKKMLLGWKQKKGDLYLTVEDNIVNRLVLGLSISSYVQDSVPLQNTAELKDYQIADINKLLGLQHYLNANPMGLGKTPETIRFLQARNVRSALIVCPKIIRYQWRNQLREWGNLESTVYDKHKIITEGIWIVNYERLRDERIRTKFKRFQWEYLVLDEAHKIKNRKSQQTLAVKDLPAQYRIALTGTPVLRYVDDLWSILHFLDVTYSGISYHAFRDYFCDMRVTPWGPIINGLTKDTNKIAILNTLLSLISVRNEAVQVGKGKTIEVVKLLMSKKQKEVYLNARKLVFEQLPDNLTIANGAILTLRLRQITSWPGLFVEEEVGPKFEWILEQCQNNPKEKFVVFSVFATTVRALSDYLAQNGICNATVTGQMADEDTENSRRQFIEGNARVLIGTIGAMGQGYDGLQKVSRLMIFLDRDWSPEIMAQAEDRLNRMGQECPVHVYYLECLGSFDRHVGLINSNRAKDIREALSTDD